MKVRLRNVKGAAAGFYRILLAVFIGILLPRAGLTAGFYNIGAFWRASPTKLIITGPTSVNQGTCSSAFTITTENNQNIPSNVLATTIVKLTDGGFGAYFSDSSCQTAITSVVISSGSTQTFYYRNFAAENVNLSASSTLLLRANYALSVLYNTVASQLSISGSPSNLKNKCSAFTVTTLDPQGNPKAVASNLAVTMSGITAGTYYGSDSTCATTAAMNFTILSGASSFTFYVKDPNPESLTFVAAATGFKSGSMVVAFSNTQLIISGPVTGTTACVGPYTITQKDNTGAAVVAPAGGILMSFSLMGHGNGCTGKIGSTCTGCSSSLQATMAAGSSTYTLYVKENNPELGWYAAYAAGYDNNAIGVMVSQTTSTNLKVLGVPNAPTNICTGPFYIQATDTAFLPRLVSAPLAVTPTTTLGSFYSDSNCSTALGATVTIPTGLVLTPPIYLKAAAAGTATLSATATAYTAAANYAVTVAANVPKLMILGPPAATVSACSYAYNVSLRDNANQLMNAAADTTVSLGAAGSSTYYLDSNCTVSTTSVTIKSGSQSARFFIKDGTKESLTLSATAGGYTASSLLVIIRDLVPPNFITTDDQSKMVLYPDGTIRSWGYGIDGQLGTGTIMNSSSAQMVFGIRNAIQITRECAVLNDNTVQCWGENIKGTVGDGTTVSKYVPTPVSGLTGVVQVSHGLQHTCALKSNGTVVCWGRGDEGEWGDGTTSTTARSTPGAAVLLSTTAVSIAASNNHACAALSDGTAQCWGQNNKSQLGNGLTANLSTPVTVNSSAGVFATLENEGDNSCFVTSGFTVSCLGENTNGAILGCANPTTSLCNVTQSLPAPVTSYHMGHLFACATLNNGRGLCWGLNNHGQQGGGDIISGTQEYFGPTTNFIDIGAGWEHTCMKTADGAVQCSGYNMWFSLGDGTFWQRLSPVNVLGL